jgi:ubiquinone/menaquinone biosynthesis C-methylase UbiE
MTDRGEPQLSSYETDDLAELYDLMYAGRKDYAGEAARVAALIRDRKADATTLLDVACGTGGHLTSFVKDFDEVVGLDLSEAMVARAKRRLPEVQLLQADMRSFDLGRTFDAAVSLFSSVGYLSTVTDLRDAIRSMGQHLIPGGVLVVEPWFFPDTFVPGFVSAHAVKDGDRAIARVAHMTRDGNTTRIEIHNLIGDSDAGIKHHSGTDVIALFERTDYVDAFESGGMRVEYLEPKFNGMGFFVGVKE